MGREIRKVVKGWEHPRDKNGNFHPMNDEFFGTAKAEYDSDKLKWEAGQHPDQLKYPDETKSSTFENWHGSEPDPEYYNPNDWKPEEMTHFQMYETVSEGTPVSPVFESLDALENWLVEQGHSRNAAAEFCKSGWAPSFAFGPGGFKKGIDIYDGF